MLPLPNFANFLSAIRAIVLVDNKTKRSAEILVLCPAFGF